MHATAARELWEEMRAVPEEPPLQRLTAPPLPSSPAGLFGCRELQQDIAGARCLELQRGDPERETNHHRFCASGECLQGARVRMQLERIAAVRICTACQRVQLGASNTDGLCSRCRPADVEPPRLVLAPLPAAPPAPPITTLHQPAAPPITHPETTMADTCNDAEGCTNEAVTKGKCGKHYQRWVRAGRPGDDAAPAVRKPRPAAAPAGSTQAVLGLGVAVARELPEVGQLPTDYLIAAVREFVRRRDEMLQLSRQLGLSTSEAA